MTHCMTISWRDQGPDAAAGQRERDGHGLGQQGRDEALTATARNAMLRLSRASGTPASTVGTTASTSDRSTWASSAIRNAVASSGATPSRPADRTTPAATEAQNAVLRLALVEIVGLQEVGREPEVGEQVHEGITVIAAATTPKSRGETRAVSTASVTNPLARTTHFCAASQRTPEAARFPICSCGPAARRRSWLSRCPGRSTGHAQSEPARSTVRSDVGDALLLLPRDPGIDRQRQDLPGRPLAHGQLPSRRAELAPSPGSGGPATG